MFANIGPPPFVFGYSNKPTASPTLDVFAATHILAVSMPAEAAAGNEKLTKSAVGVPVVNVAFTYKVSPLLLQNAAKFDTVPQPVMVGVYAVHAVMVLPATQDVTPEPFVCKNCPLVPPEVGRVSDHVPATAAG